MGGLLKEEKRGTSGTSIVVRGALCYTVGGEKERPLANCPPPWFPVSLNEKKRRKEEGWSSKRKKN